jgi:DNA adenine methylase
MRTPITYYGGKQLMLRHILPLIPNHRIYTEAFVGGGAVFWAKPPTDIECINDLNRELINFYEVLMTKPDELKRLINVSLHSRDTHRLAININKYPFLFTDVHRAWAVWCLSVQGFSGKLDGSWGYDKTSNSTVKAIGRHIETDFEQYAIRLKKVQIESNDAVKVIESRDTSDTFHYCDPPYFNSHCGHYAGYSEGDFTRLLDTLSNAKGKFMLSSYPSEVLSKYVRQQGWKQVSFDKNVSVNSKSSKRKVEVLTMNY